MCVLGVGEGVLYSGVRLSPCAAWGTVIRETPCLDSDSVAMCCFSRYCCCDLRETLHSPKRTERVSSTYLSYSIDCLPALCHTYLRDRRGGAALVVEQNRNK